MNHQIVRGGGPFSGALINASIEIAARTCPHCAAAMKRMDEQTVSEQYTRQIWWKCTECRRSRYSRA